MSQPLLTTNFRFMTDNEICHLDITNVPDDNPTGYILEADLEYLRHLHELHNDYPLTPEKVTLTEDQIRHPLRKSQTLHLSRNEIETNASRVTI